jgi:4-hydroxybenzoate polyprenyltransferase
MTLARILHISRPHFWLYEAGTYAIGIAAAYAIHTPHVVPVSILVAFFVYFLFPGNLYIYGINDIYDYETDRLNPKKAEYEALVLPREHRSLWSAIAVTTAPFLVLLYSIPHLAIITFFLFLFFAGFYSAKPIRAKSIPGLDSVFSAGHYVATGVFAYLLAGGTHLSIPLITAAMSWAIAMHAYSAVPDIEADGAGGIHTIATVLGKQKTILICAALYAVAGILSFSSIGLSSLLLSALYLFLMMLSFATKSDKRLFTIYRIFPYVNAASGMILFFIALLG